MSKKDTDNLQLDLMSSPNLSNFLENNENNFISESVTEILNKVFSEKNISKAALAKRSGMSEIYLHQIFAGRRTPSRNRLLCLCYGLGISLDETQELLKVCGCAPLYPKIRRDAIIVYGILHQIDLFENNDQLFTENEETLC
ncbi:MAG: helix-turn-helix transcriptional regulator [Oscillospiraceae bacterium]|nr:helix-turn-helix transcriptional regulator [Oscillospiraceae bacterium]